MATFNNIYVSTPAIKPIFLVEDSDIFNDRPAAHSQTLASSEGRKRTTAPGSIGPRIRDRIIPSE
jgi:hypothetical protein